VQKCAIVNYKIKKREGANMGMYSLIEDNVNKFYDIAFDKISECENVYELADVMQEHEHLLQGSSDADCKDDLYSEMWYEYVSKYATN